MINNTIQIFATINDNENELVLFISNWMLQNYYIKNETDIIDIINIKNNNNNINILLSKGILYRIDSMNCNPVQKWLDIGSTTHLTDQQFDIIEKASQLNPNTINVYQQTNNSISFKINVPIYGLALIVVNFD